EIGAAVIMGVLWSSWHVPAFFTPGMPQQMMPMISFLAFAAAFGVFLAIVFFRAGESVVPTMAAHVVLNIMLAIGGASLRSVVYWNTLAAATILVAVVLVATSTRHMISRRHSATGAGT